jgi:hypothetical protein
LNIAISPGHQPRSQPNGCREMASTYAGPPSRTRKRYQLKNLLQSKEPVTGTHFILAKLGGVFRGRRSFGACGAHGPSLDSFSNIQAYGRNARRQPMLKSAEIPSVVLSLISAPLTWLIARQPRRGALRALACALSDKIPLPIGKSQRGIRKTDPIGRNGFAGFIVGVYPFEP